MRAAAAAGAALLRADITARLAFLDILMVPIAVMWAPTISPAVHNIPGRTHALTTGRTLTLVTGRTLTLVTGRMLTRAADTSAGITAGCIAARAVAIIAATSVTSRPAQKTYPFCL